MASPRTSFTLSTRRAPHGSRRVILLAGTLGLLAIGAKCVAMAQGQMSPLDRGAIGITAPLAQSGIRGVRGLGSLGEVFHLGRILAENDQLTQERAFLESRIAELESLKTENATLRKQLGLKPIDKCKPVEASVVARPFDPWLETVILDRGEESGIKPGCLVANNEGLVGKVSACDHGYSRVELVASPRFRAAGITPDQVEGVVRGVSTNELQFDYVEARSKVAVGDKVYSKASPEVPGGEAFAGSPATPGDILIGQIVKLTREQGGFLRLSLEPAARTNSLQSLTVYVP